MDLWLLVLNLAMSSWFTIVEFIHKDLKLNGSKMGENNPNGPKLIIQCFCMDGGKKKSTEK